MNLIIHSKIMHQIQRQIGPLCLVKNIQKRNHTINHKKNCIKRRNYRILLSRGEGRSIYTEILNIQFFVFIVWFNQVYTYDICYL